MSLKAETSYKSIDNNQLNKNHKSMPQQLHVQEISVS